VRADRRHAGCGLQPAQALAIEPPRRIEQRCAIAAQGAERMFQQGEQGDRREALVDRRDQRAQQRRRRRVDQRRAG
jgi:hypothetical protein